jgi:hypothetical protein
MTLSPTRLPHSVATGPQCTAVNYASALVRPDQDALDEAEIEKDSVTALNEASQQYFDELHAEIEAWIHLHKMHP